jgi:hypothetical protein
MLPKTVITCVAAAALIVGNASASTYAASGGGHGAGNWPQEGTWNWPFTHKQPSWRWVQRCQ